MLKEKPFYLSDEQIQWVDQTLKSMSLEEKVGQLFCVLYKNGTQEEIDRIQSVLSPGGAMYRTIPIENAIQVTHSAADCGKP